MLLRFFWEWEMIGFYDVFIAIAVVQSALRDCQRKKRISTRPCATMKCLTKDCRIIFPPRLLFHIAPLFSPLDSSVSLL